MQTERWVRIEQLFAEALALPVAGRAAFLQRACGDDTDLRDEIEALLRSHDAPGVLDAAPQPAPAPRASLAIGASIGAWRVERLIGRGGMGEVYAVLRADAGFEQRAALKLLRFEAGGELARFHAERRILARLEHPGIARLLDGGEAPDGRPYTVMEYVEGRSLTDHCREHDATLAERLALFAQVCDAVALAHRMLIVHRDLKPANTLVDATGHVKLLDFGIAKLLDATAAGEVEQTIAPFTPDYAAPEQISGQAVTTATDIYALGVLLFELLTGERPLRMHGLPSAQVLRALFDRAAPLASRIAQANADAPLPVGALQGDLDAIVAKCLRREPALRYETVDALKLDLQRHLAHEPVLAREGARLYVVGRALRRYRWAVAAACALILTLAAGLAGTLWQARRAETQARTAAAVQEFMRDLFRANASRQADPVKARQTTARELLDLGAEEIESAMTDAPAAKLSALRLLAQLYDDLSLPNDEVRLHRQAVELARGLYGPNAPEVAAALTDLAGAMYGSDATDQRGPILREAQAILDRNRDESSPTRGRLLLKQVEFHQTSDLPKALGYARRSVRVFAALPASADLAEAWYMQGLIESYSGEYRNAVSSLTRAIDISRAVQGVPNPKLVVLYYQLADTQRSVPDFAGAERSARLALQMALAINGEDHVDAVRTRAKLGDVLLDSGRTREGLELMATAKRGVLELLGPNDPFHTPAILWASGLGQARAGNLADGLADMRAALAIWNKKKSTLQNAFALEETARTLVEMGRFDEARSAIDEAIGIRERVGQKRGTRAFSGAADARIRLALAEGEPTRARAMLGDHTVGTGKQAFSRQQLSHWLFVAEIALQTEDPGALEQALTSVRAEAERSGQAAYLNSYLASADLLEGKAKLMRHDAEGALPLLRRALATREELLTPTSPKLAEAQIALARCHLDLGQTGPARSLATAAAAIHAQQRELGEQYRTPLRQLQARLVEAAK